MTQQITRYLNQTLGEMVTLRPWSGADRLPLYLRDRFVFREGMLLDTPVLFMIAHEYDGATPAAVRKQIAQVHEKWETPVIYVCEQITAYNRKRLVEQRVPFVDPGKQMYLPMFGVDFCERFGTTKPRADRLSPSTQAILIHAILHAQQDAPLTAAGIGARLGYAPITISRAFDELEDTELAESEFAGRTRLMHMAASGRALWEKALPMLRTPVKHLYFVHGDTQTLHGLVAGISALAQQTMLAEPTTPVLAVSRADWKFAFEHGEVDRVPHRDAGTTDIEVWAYPPSILSDGKAVDPLSLYLSLKDDGDERVESALESMLEAALW